MANNCDPIGSNTNAVSLAVAKVCNADAQTVWYYQQPNDISSFAAVLERVARSPISLDRQRRKGAVTNLTASPAFPQDTTIDALAFWSPVFMYTKWKGPAAGEFGYAVSAVSGTAYTVGANGALPQNSLVIARGFKTPENNGLKVVGSGSSATSIPTTGLIAETPTGAESLHECGYRFAVGDLQVDANGDLISTTKDFTTLPLFVGSYIYVGGATATNKFATAENSGFARVIAITANKLSIDNTGEQFTIDAGATKLVDLYYGMWCRNVAVNHPDFSTNHMLIEVGYDLAAGRSYEYAEVAMLNTAALALPLTDKSTLDFATVAKDVSEATLTRRLGTWKNFTANELFNTSDDIARLRIRDADENGLTTYFTDCTINVNNNVSPKNVLGVLGAADLNYGNIEISDSMTTLFTDTGVTSALRNNTTAGFEAALVNNEGACIIDQPAITLGGGEKAFPVNDKVEIALENDAFGSDIYGYTQSMTLMRYTPPVA